MALGWQQLLLVLVLVLVLFGGRGRISSLMGDMAKGIKSFRAGLRDDEAEPREAATLTAQPVEPVTVEPAKTQAEPKA